MTQYLQKLADLIDRLEAAQKEQSKVISETTDLLRELASTLPVGNQCEHSRGKRFSDSLRECLECGYVGEIL